MSKREGLLLVLMLCACTGQNTQELTRNSRTGDAGRAADDAGSAAEEGGEERAEPDRDAATADPTNPELLDAGHDSAAQADDVQDGVVDGSAVTRHSDAGLCIAVPAGGGTLPTTFRLRVYDSVANGPLPGVHVVVLDNETGERLSPSHEGDSDARGEILFSDLPNDRPFGFKAVGMGNRWVDTYSFNYTTDPDNPVGAGLYVFVAGGDGFAAQSGEFTLRPDAAFVRGYLQWRGPNTLSASGVGCAAILGSGLDDVRYILDALLPSPASARSPEQGTFAHALGGFVIGNAAPGRRVISATLPDGTVIGSTSFVAFPRSASTGGLGNVIIASIFLDGTVCERNPTPQSCE